MLRPLVLLSLLTAAACEPPKPQQSPEGASRPPVAPHAGSADAGARWSYGRLPPEAIQHVVRANFGEMRRCYERGLGRDAKLSGKVVVKFVIDLTGAVPMAADAGSSLPDPAVVECVRQAFTALRFPQPEGGVVTVVYPIMFNPAP